MVEEWDVPSATGRFDRVPTEGSPQSGRVHAGWQGGPVCQPVREGMLHRAQEPRDSACSLPLWAAAPLEESAY